MKNRYMLLIVAILTASANIDATSSNKIAQAVKAAHRNFVAFNKTGRVSLKQKYGIIKRTYFDVNGMKYPGSAKQWGIDKLHTQKRFWMAYSAVTTAFLTLASQQKYDAAFFLLETLPKTCQSIMNHNYDGPNPFAQAEEVADKAALL